MNMGTTTVRLDDEDDAILDMLASEYGGRSSVIRHALRVLAADHRRQDALRSFLADWDAENGPVNDHDIDTMAERYNL